MYNKYKITRHHKIPDSLNWSRHFDNLLKIHDFKHRALHILYDIKWLPTMPAEQILQHLEMMWAVFIPEVKQDIKTIIEWYWKDIYNEKCFKK